MREIKFRAWIDEYNCYFHDFNMRSSGFGNEKPKIEVTIPSGGHSDLKKWLNSNYFTLEQYTGFKDKNGVDIYEGDIFFDGLNNCVIEFDELNCAFVANDGCEKHYLGAHISNVEVIGNIRQNHELWISSNK